MTPDITAPAVPVSQSFDPRAGSALERLVFGHRSWGLLFCLVVTLVMGWHALQLRVNASWDKLLPQSHEWVRNATAHRDDLKGLGNAVRIVVENTRGDIFDPGFLEVLRGVSDEAALLPGVDRPWLKSLWTPTVRWLEITEEGFQGGPVMPDTWDGGERGIELLRANVARAGIVGTLVANDLRSSMVFVPLADGAQALDYGAFSRALEQSVRSRFERDGVRIHVVGFAMVMGEMIDGVRTVMALFFASAAIAALALWAYTRCLRSTALVLACSAVAVVWQAGLVALLGHDLNPYSVLVPFLVFAIGVSHGAQKMNGIMQDIGRGTERLVAARLTFRRLFITGVTALLADVVGFAVLMLVDIPAIRELALTASLGVAALIFTNLLLLPVLLSYTGVDPRAARRSLAQENAERSGRSRIARLWDGLDRFTEPRHAWTAVAIAAAITALAAWVARDLRIGDLDAGAPELRAESRYNRDNAYVTSHYALSSDLFAVIVESKPGQCTEWPTLVQADRLGWALQAVPGVQTTVSLADGVRQITAGSFEGHPKWLTLSRNAEITHYAGDRAGLNNRELFNNDCSVLPVTAYLADHKADTLAAVAAAAAAFAREHESPELRFKLAGGSAGAEAATNEVVRDASRRMTLYIYAAVALLCLVTFRNLRAVIVALVPLAVTSIACEALMVWLGIGVKVATLPVIALGVGIGVDYSLYLLSVQLKEIARGADLATAYRRAVQFTGKVVALVGFTLAAGVVTWAFSPLKFQADMGLLLTFMFLFNMVGALVLIPALSRLVGLGKPSAAA